jgi:hypothetical protein
MGVRRAALALALCSLLAFGPGAGAEPRPVQDLAYGEGLFLYFKDDYFSSITRLLAAQTRNELPHDADDAELLLGGLHLSYGQQDVPPPSSRRCSMSESARVRDRAWFYPARWRISAPRRHNRRPARQGLPEDSRASAACRSAGARSRSASRTR